MSIKIGFVMDPIENIKSHKDTTFAMMLEAQKRGWDIYTIRQNDLLLKEGLTIAKMSKLNVVDQTTDYFTVLETTTQPLIELDVVLMRKDPPFNMNYIYTTYLLELAEKKGLLVINKPQSLRDANEKLFAAWFPQCCPDTVVSAKKENLMDFVNQEKDIIVKPLDGMGGESIFHIQPQTKDTESIIESMTHGETVPIMAQKFIPEIKSGDKRVLMIDGQAIPYALARIPAPNDFRGNIAQGASTEGRELTVRDQWICNEVGPTLKAKGLTFVGLDIIGDYLTEINVTSPTCVRELDKIFNLNICAEFFDVIAAQLSS